MASTDFFYILNRTADVTFIASSQTAAFFIHLAANYTPFMCVFT